MFGTSDKVKIDELSSFFFVALSLILLLFNNGFYLFFPAFILYLLFFLVQKPLRPGVFMLIVFQHFLQISAGVWLANYLGKELNFNTPSRSDSIIASTIGLCFLMMPSIYFQNKIPRYSSSQLVDFAMQFDIGKVMYLYLGCFFLASFLGSIAFLFSGFTQIIISLVKVKWVFFLLFGYLSILRKDRLLIFYLFILLEFVNGFLGFFSDFKTVIYFVIVLLLGLLERLRFQQVIQIFLISAVLALFALIWTNIKSDYRSFLNQGEKSQNVSVESKEALGKLVDLSSDVKNRSFEAGVVGMLDRLQYTYHFAKTIDRVPEYLPHEYGANWLRSIEFTTTPRFLNPDKPSFDATEKTKKYTGLRYAGRQEGTSFSLGYFPDCYIDFGLYGMMFVLLLLGTLYMVISRFLFRNSPENYLLKCSVVSAFFLEFNALEMDNTYLLGRLFSSFVTFFILLKFLFPLIFEYIRRREPATTPANLIDMQAG
jgi:hypothetical protein